MRQLIATNMKDMEKKLCNVKRKGFDFMRSWAFMQLILWYLALICLWVGVFEYLQLSHLPQEFYKYFANRKRAWDMPFLIAWGDAEHNLTSMSGQSPQCWYLRLSCYCIPIFIFIPEGKNQEMTNTFSSPRYWCLYRSYLAQGNLAL